MKNTNIKESVISDFEQGFDLKEKLVGCVTIFGSARLKPDNKYYIQTQLLAQKLAEKGVGVITGGGGGIMEAGNKGCYEKGGISGGICMHWDWQEGENKYLQKEYTITLNHLFIRKYFLMSSLKAFIYCPGGFGTMDELFELLTLMQTKKKDKVEIILMGVEFWTPIMDVMIEKLEFDNLISKDDKNLYTITDDLDFIIGRVSKAVLLNN